MAVKVKWREAVFEDLKARAAALGWKEFDEEKLIGLIEKNAEMEPNENGFSPRLHKAYVRAASFSDIGRKRFLNAFRGTFASPSKKTRIYRKKKDGDVVPSMIDPDCTACSGTGVSTKGNQCAPCSKNGVRVKARPNRDLPGDATMIMDGKHVAGPAPTVPPPPPSKRPPPPPPSKGKKRPPPPPPPSRKRPPPPPPKKRVGGKAKKKPPPDTPPTSSKAGATPPRLRAPVFFAVCIQVRLDSSYDESVVVEELNRYVEQRTGFGAKVEEAKRLGEEVFDLRVHYAVHMTEVFDAIEAHEWVKAAQARPVQDLGQGEPIL